MVRDYVSFKWLRDLNIWCLIYCLLRWFCNVFGDNYIVKCYSGNEILKDCILKVIMF